MWIDHLLSVGSLVISSDIETSYYKREVEDQAYPKAYINPSDDKELESAVEWKWLDQFNRWGWVGAAHYEVVGQPLSNPKYNWDLADSGGGSWFVYSLPGHTPQDEHFQLLYTDTPWKQLHIDFGDAHTGFSKSTKLKVTVTNDNPNDPVVGPGEWRIKWRLPFTKLGDLLDEHKKSQEHLVVSGLYSWGSENAEFHDPAKTFDVATVLEGAAGMASALASEHPAAAAVLSCGQMIAGALDLSYSYGGTSGTTGAEAWGNSPWRWESIQQHPEMHGNVHDPDLLSDPDGYMHTEMRLYQVRYYTIKRQIGDVYDHHGFVVANQIHRRDVTTLVRVEPFYFPEETPVVDPTPTPTSEGETTSIIGSTPEGEPIAEGGD